MVRALLLATLSLAVPLAPGGSAVGHVTVDPVGREPVAIAAQRPLSAWTWPLAPVPEVVGVFHAPPTPWSAGHRGVDLAAAVGQPVLSAGRGQVTFAGQVAGRGVVVVQHADGLRTSYEPVVRRVAVGTLVHTGQVIGVLGPGPGHCPPTTCLHWGVRRGDRYLDPLLLVGAGPPVLLPLSRPSPR